VSTFEDVARIESRLTRRYQDHLSQIEDNKEELESTDDLSKFFEPLEDEKDLLRFPFAEWIKEHGEDDETEEVVSATGASDSTQDPSQACPYIAGKQGQTTVPADHPNIPGMDFSDPEAIKSCPFLSAKAEAVEETGAQEKSAVPSDHPAIPRVDFNDPEAVKACPFLSAKKKEEASTVAVQPTVPSDHPAIPGVDFSNSEAMKACPFLSAQGSQGKAQ